MNECQTQRLVQDWQQLLALRQHACDATRPSRPDCRLSHPELSDSGSAFSHFKPLCPGLRSVPRLSRAWSGPAVGQHPAISKPGILGASLDGFQRVGLHHHLRTTRHASITNRPPTAATPHLAGRGAESESTSRRMLQPLAKPERCHHNPCAQRTSSRRAHRGAGKQGKPTKRTVNIDSRDPRPGCSISRSIVARPDSSLAPFRCRMRPVRTPACWLVSEWLRSDL